MTKHVYCHPLTRWLRDLVGRVCWGWSALAAGNDMAKWFVWAGPSGCQSCAGTTDILHGEQIANMSNFVTKCGRKILHSGKVLPQMGKLVAFTTLRYTYSRFPMSYAIGEFLLHLVSNRY